jgi:hypothetical protein
MRPPARTPTPPAQPAAPATCWACCTAPPRRLPAGDDPALPAGPVSSTDRRAARLRPRHRAPLDPPLPHPRHRRAGRPAPQRPSTTGHPGWASASAGCWQSPRHGPSAGSTSGSAAPPSACGPCTAVCARSPAGGGPAWSHAATPTATRSSPPSTSTSATCPLVRCCWPRTRPRQPAAVGAGHLDPPGAAPAGHDPRHQPAPHHLRRRRPCHGSPLVSGDPHGHQRHLHYLLRTPPGRLATSASGGGVCDHVIIHRSKIVQRWLKTHPRLLVSGVKG